MLKYSHLTCPRNISTIRPLSSDQLLLLWTDAASFLVLAAADCSCRATTLFLLWLVVASFLALAAEISIAFVTGHIFLASTAATAIALTGGNLFSGIGGDNGYCFHDRPFLSGIDGSNGYCIGGWQPLFWYWLALTAATTIALAVGGLFFGVGGNNGYCFHDRLLLSGIDDSNYYCFGWWHPLLWY